MTHTIVGLFDSKQEAHAARTELVQKGFIENDIDFSEGRVGDASTTTTTTDNSVGGFFSHLFGDDEATARNYTDVAGETEAILTVQVDSQDRARQVAQIFDNHSAIDVDERASQNQQNYSQTTDTNRARTAADTTRTTTEGNTAIPVIEENLSVGKRTVEQGGVRVRSRIVEKPVEETVRLRQERVVVNRHPVNRAVSDADRNNFREGEMELTEHSEEAVVSKQARVVEEVSVGKTVEERDQVVRDTVRRTDVDVEEIDTIDTDESRRSANR